MLLKDADRVYAGTRDADRIYRGSVLAWEKGGGVVEPTTEFWYSSEGATDGAIVNNTNGGTGSGTPWATTSNNVNLIFGSPGRWDTRCIRIPDNDATGHAQWNRATASSTVRIGFWIKPGAIPTVDARLCDLRQTSTAGTVGGILITPSTTTNGRRFRIMQASSGLSVGQSPQVTLGEWYWVSLGWNCTTKTARLVVYNADGSLFHDSGSVGLTTTYTSLTTARFGRPVVYDVGLTDYDDIQFDGTSSDPLPPWMGSAVAELLPA